MDYVMIAITISLLYTCILLLKLRRGPAARLPPGPPRHPIKGNLDDTAPWPYRAFAALADTYGPVISLKLGTVTVVIASTVEAAKEVLKEKDALFSHRSVPHAVMANDHHMSSVVWLPPTDKWRSIRKLCSVHMFAAPRLNSTHDLRLSKIHQLKNYLQETAARPGGAVVDVGGVIFTTVLNIITNTLFSVDFAYYGSTDTHEYEKIVRTAMEDMAKTNIADYFQILRWVDPAGIYKKSGVHGQRVLKVFDDIVEERMNVRGSSGESFQRDMLDALLDLIVGNDYGLSLDDIKHLFMDLLLAGTDTTATTLEWAMSELIRSPQMMERARAELREVVGDNEFVQESNIQNLPYLQSLVKETFRMYPAGPLLLPREASTNVELMGYSVPKGSRVLVNVWAIGRDSRIWGSDVDQFRPERFLDSPLDYKGRDFELLPFGSGRRICPGLPLAHRAIHIILGTLIQFNWGLEGGVAPNELDMTEKRGVITVKRANPLRAMPSKICI